MPAKMTVSCSGNVLHINWFDSVNLPQNATRIKEKERLIKVPKIK